MAITFSAEPSDTHFLFNGTNHWELKGVNGLPVYGDPVVLEPPVYTLNGSRNYNPDYYPHYPDIPVCLTDSHRILPRSSYYAYGSQVTVDQASRIPELVHPHVQIYLNYIEFLKEAHERSECPIPLMDFKYPKSHETTQDPDMWYAIEYNLRVLQGFGPFTEREEEIIYDMVYRSFPVSLLAIEGELHTNNKGSYFRDNSFHEGKLNRHSLRILRRTPILDPPNNSSDARNTTTGTQGYSRVVRLSEGLAGYLYSDEWLIAVGDNHPEYYYPSQDEQFLSARSRNTTAAGDRLLAYKQYNYAGDWRYPGGTEDKPTDDTVGTERLISTNTGMITIDFNQNLRFMSYPPGSPVEIERQSLPKEENLVNTIGVLDMAVCLNLNISGDTKWKIGSISEYQMYKDIGVPQDQLNWYNERDYWSRVVYPSQDFYNRVTEISELAQGVNVVKIPEEVMREYPNEGYEQEDGIFKHFNMVLVIYPETLTESPTWQASESWYYNPPHGGGRLDYCEIVLDDELKIYGPHTGYKYHYKHTFRVNGEYKQYLKVATNTPLFY